MTRRGTAGTSVSPDAAVIFVALGTVVQRMRKFPFDGSMAETLKGLKPRPRQVAALFQLVGERPLSVGDLAARMQISLATASQLVGELADLGLVDRVEDPADRRRTLVEVTSDHRSLVQAVLETRLRPLDTALSRLTEEERAGLSVGLQRLAAELESLDGGSDPRPLQEVVR